MTTRVDPNCKACEAAWRKFKNASHPELTNMKPFCPAHDVWEPKPERKPFVPVLIRGGKK